MFGLFARASAALAVLALSLSAQRLPGDLPRDSGAALQLKYARFDPLEGTPWIPAVLRGGADVELWIVQIDGEPTEHDRAAIRGAGAELHGYLPHHAYVARMPAGVAAAVRTLPQVRWVGRYEPVYRLEAALAHALVNGLAIPARSYHLVVVDKHTDKPALGAAIRALGGTVEDEQEGSLLFTVRLDALQLLAAARLDQVLWIERQTSIGHDMNNARIQSGAGHVETVAGYTGAGVRGHIYEGVEGNHVDFSTPMTAIGCATPETHGHCTAGIVFGNGTSHPNARGMAPDAVGFYTNEGCTTSSRNNLINTVVNTHHCMFTTASWGQVQTSQYTAVSADADDIVFDYRIPWTNSQSNLHNNNSRPEAWAKNVISVGGVQHFDNADPSDDSWQAGGASTGPAADGRIKPDLCAYYDMVHTSDRTGTAGYTSTDHYNDFGGTSAATPIVAGAGALAIQMYTDGIFGNELTAPGGTRFQNRPLAQTLKGLLIASAARYPFVAPASTDNLRHHQGWGFPDLRSLWERRDRTLIVAEDEPLEQGHTSTYWVEVAAGEPALDVSLTWVEPAANPASAMTLINDLSLRVTAPDGTSYWGNQGLTISNVSTPGGSADTIDSVENVLVANPAAGIWKIEVLATSIFMDAHLPTAATDATFALVAIGGTPRQGSACADHSAGDTPHLGPANLMPFGGEQNAALPTLFASDNGGSERAVYFDVTVVSPLRLEQVGVNTGAAAGTPIALDVYMTASGTQAGGNETNAGAWTRVASGKGTAAGQDATSYAPLDAAVTLLPGTYGMAVVARDFGHRVTNGNGSNQSYADADLSLSLGSTSAAPFAGPVAAPRVANVELDYTPFPQASSLPTLFASDGGTASGGAVYFDLTALEPVVLAQLDVNAGAAAAGTPIAIDLYLTAPGNVSAGNETNPAAWTRVASGTGSAAGLDAPSPCLLDTAVTLEPGTYGAAIVARSFGHRTTTGNGANQFYVDPSVLLSFGSATNAPFAGTVLAPRVANLAVHYLQAPAANANQRYQLLVRRDLIDHAGLISGLAFAPCGTGLHHSEMLEIKMSHVPAGWTLSSTFAANLPNPITVLSATGYDWPLTADRWNPIGLHVGFDYDGTSDLVIEVVSWGNRVHASAGGFHRDDETPRVFANGWLAVPVNATGGDDAGQKVRLEFGCAHTSHGGRSCGDLEVRVAGLPVLGQSYGFHAYHGAPSAPIVLHIGFTNAFPFPIDLSILGFTGCSLQTNIAVPIGTSTDASGHAVVQVATPNQQGTIGLAGYGQFAQIDFSAPGGAVFSGWGRAMHGLQP